MTAVPRHWFARTMIRPTHAGWTHDGTSANETVMRLKIWRRMMIALRSWRFANDCIYPAFTVGPFARLQLVGE